MGLSSLMMLPLDAATPHVDMQSSMSLEIRGPPSILRLPWDLLNSIFTLLFLSPDFPCAHVFLSVLLYLLHLGCHLLYIAFAT